MSDTITTGGLAFWHLAVESDRLNWVQFRAMYEERFARGGGGGPAERKSFTPFRCHLELVGSGAVVALMLYAHLGLVSRQSPRRLAGAAAGVAALLFAATWAWEHVQTANDLTGLAYMKHLEAPLFRLAPDHSPEEFIARAQALQGEVDALRRK